jgi:ribokinase
MIVVFGSINLDMVFAPSHLPAPGETVLCDGFAAFPGGKGANQAVAAARGGAGVRMVGCVGDDSFSATSLDAFAAAGVDCTGVRRGRLPTGCASIMVAPDGENQIVVASGANREVLAGQLAEAPPGEGDILLLQMEIDPSENWKAVDIARRAGARVMLNNAPAGPIPTEILSSLGLLAVNEIEVMQAAGERGLAATEPLTAARALNELFGLDIVVTLGGAGATWVSREGAVRSPAPDVEVVDTVGAGDAFTGALAAAMDRGLDPPAALAFACAAGGLACRTHGAQAALANRAEIETVAAELAPRVSMI